MMNFDTYEAIKQLCSVGIKEEQAAKIVNTISNAREYDFSRLATKEQVAALTKDMEKFATKEQVAALTKDMEKFATREQLLEAENKLKEEIFSQTSQLKDEISKSKNETLRWVIGLFVTLLIAMFANNYFH